VIKELRNAIDLNNTGPSCSVSMPTCFLAAMHTLATATSGSDAATSNLIP
jgi:hypothetical protein